MGAKPFFENHNYFKLSEGKNYNVYICQNHKYFIVFKNTLDLNVDGSTMPIRFNGINAIAPKITANNTIAINFEGTCVLDKKHGLSKALESSQQNSGDLVVLYNLNKQTHLTEMIQMAASFFNEKGDHLKTIEVFIAKEVAKKAPVVLLEEETESVPIPKKRKNLFRFFKK